MDHSGWFATKSGMWAFVIVELHPFSNACLRFRSSLPGVQVDAFVFEGAPQPPDEDIVEEPALAVHRDANAGSAQTVCPGKRRELAALIRIHDLRAAELVDRLVQRFDAKLCLQRVRDAPGQNLAGEPVDDRDQLYRNYSGGLAERQFIPCSPSH